METLHRCPLAQILIIVALVNHDIGSILFAALPICLRAARLQRKGFPVQGTCTKGALCKG